MTYAKEKLFPVITLIKKNVIPSHLPCSKFIDLKTHITLNYCTNIAFYLVLKKKRVSIKDHPITERLLKYRGLLQQLDSLETPDYKEQLDKFLELAKNSDLEKIISEDSNEKLKSSKKKKLKLLTGSDENSGNQKNKTKVKESNGVSGDSVSKNGATGNRVFDNYGNLSSDDDDDKDDKSVDETKSGEDAKRAITYEMAKNKGLTPHRKKEQRNPRVKHRNKYRKALIKRKGQVREAQRELTKYGGEMSGIKASVIKSRKFK